MSICITIWFQNHFHRASLHKYSAAKEMCGQCGSLLLSSIAFVLCKLCTISPRVCMKKVSRLLLTSVALLTSSHSGLLRRCPKWHLNRVSFSSAVERRSRQNIKIAGVSVFFLAPVNISVHCGLWRTALNLKKSCTASVLCSVLCPETVNVTCLSKQICLCVSLSVEKSESLPAITLHYHSDIRSIYNFYIKHLKWGVFNLNIFWNVMYSCNQSFIFSIITPVFSVTWSSEITTICWFAAQKTFLCIISVDNTNNIIQLTLYMSFLSLLINLIGKYCLKYWR